ncbi:MAG: DUF5714 domain-containing protein [Rhodothermaceae bacterium]
MEHKSGCLICGSELVYENTSSEHKCFYCGEIFNSNNVCSKGHFICDTCHSSGAMDLIEKYTINTNLTDPVKIANYLMKNRAVKMHGPEHHFLVPAVLLSAYYNTIGKIEGKGVDIKTARKRGEKVPGGFCGFNGACGAGIGTGIFVSILTKATPVTSESWKLSNLATSRALEAIAHCGGPRCCKRDTFLALFTAQDYVKEHLDISIDIDRNVTCEFSQMNKECLYEECTFFKK